MILRKATTRPSRRNFLCCFYSFIDVYFTKLTTTNIRPAQFDPSPLQRFFYICIYIRILKNTFLKEFRMFHWGKWCCRDFRTIFYIISYSKNKRPSIKSHSSPHKASPSECWSALTGASSSCKQRHTWTTPDLSEALLSESMLILLWLVYQVYPCLSIWNAPPTLNSFIINPVRLALEHKNVPRQQTVANFPAPTWSCRCHYLAIVNVHNNFRRV